MLKVLLTDSEYICFYFQSDLKKKNTDNDMKESLATAIENYVSILSFLLVLLLLN